MAAVVAEARTAVEEAVTAAVVVEDRAAVVAEDRAVVEEAVTAAVVAEARTVVEEAVLAAVVEAHTEAVHTDTKFQAYSPPQILGRVFFGTPSMFDGLEVQVLFTS
jgi:hypothetical protein